MTARKLQSPGVEINEIDRSNYDKVDYSLPNSPTNLVFGFASRGEDMAFKWINSFATLNETYGQPSTEFEAYFYNAAAEILNRGATCIAAKLPYANEAYEKFNYVEYSIGNLSSLHETSIEVEEAYETINDIRNTLNAVLVKLGEDYDTSTIAKIAITCKDIWLKYKDDDEFEDIETINDIVDRLRIFIDTYKEISPYANLLFNDTNLTSVFGIEYSSASVDTLDHFDSLLTKSNNIGNDKIRIYDITRSQYDKFNDVDDIINTNESGEYIHTNDFLGIVPVIVTPLNAMFFQNILTHTEDISAIPYGIYNSIHQLSTVANDKVDSSKMADIYQYTTIPLSSGQFDAFDSTVYENESLSRRAAMQFPSITFDGANHFDSTYLK